MNDLLDYVLDAHGGLNRWSGVSTLTAKLAADGPFWKLRGFPDAFGDEPVDDRPPAGRISERAVNENDGRTGHDELLSFRWAIGCPLLGPSSGARARAAQAASCLYWSITSWERPALTVRVVLSARIS